MNKQKGGNNHGWRNNWCSRLKKRYSIKLYLKIVKRTLRGFFFLYFSECFIRVFPSCTHIQSLNNFERRCSYIITIDRKYIRHRSHFFFGFLISLLTKYRLASNLIQNLHISSLLLISFSYELLIVTYEMRLYLHLY